MPESNDNQNKGKITGKQAYANAAKILKAITPKKEQLGPISKNTARLIDLFKKTVALSKEDQAENVVKDEKQDVNSEHFESKITLKIGKKIIAKKPEYMKPKE
jgi:maltodextrin utilization protein YvdJ